MPKNVPNPPIAEDFMESARSFGNYTLAFSLADLMDNSITAKATKIDILADYEKQEIRVIDNGCGMNESELINAMRMGSRNPNTENHTDDLGRFGLGLKTASFAQASVLTVISKKRGKLTGAKWDLDDVSDWEMEVYSPSECQPLQDNQIKGQSGTIIIWQKLKRLLEGESLSREEFNALLSEAETELSLVFHRYLSGDLPSGKKIIVTRNHRELIPFDPFCKSNEATQVLDEEPIDFESNGKKVKIEMKPFILPHFSKLSKNEFELLGGKEGYVKNQGFYIYRQYRLIIRGTWFKLAPHGEFSKLARIRVDIPNSVDMDWRISVDKSEAQIPTKLKKRFKALLSKWVIPRSAKVHTSRATIERKEIKQVWNLKHLNASTRQFSINREHPIISDFRKHISSPGANSETRNEFKKVLKLIENCLPINDIHVFMNDNPDKVNLGYTDPDEILDMAKKLFISMKKGKHSQKAIYDILKTTSPFNSYFEQIEEHLKDENFKNE
jgi:hypothetical protein